MRRRVELSEGLLGDYCEYGVSGDGLEMRPRTVC